MPEGPIKVICRWCGDARRHGSDCARDDELRASCHSGSGADFFTASLAADFDEFAAIMRRLRLNAPTKRH
jgi:hypothetical protein